jgi:charged multivesicular body protein 6
MKNQRDKLHQYQRRITVITDREKEVARECLRKGDKRRALLALRRKKYQESVLTKTDAQLAQLEILTNDVEFALVQKDVLFGLQQGTKVLNEIHKEIGGAEGVEKLLGESEEARAYERVRYDHFMVAIPRAVLTKVVPQEISEMLRGQISNHDEDEVEDELDALEREVTGIKLPDAPTNKLPENEQVREETPRERAQRRAREQAQNEPLLA